MKIRKKLLFIIGAAVIFIAIMAYLVFRYAPWHKIMKIPTSNETAFIRSDILRTPAPNALSFDFEVAPGQDVPNGIYKGIAHSGEYSAKAFGKNSFSVSVVRSTGEIGLANLNGVAMSASVYVFPTDNEINGSLVFAVNNSVGVNICWKGVHFNGPLIPVEQWTKISAYFDLSDVRLRSDDQVQLYFWNNSNTDILVDDFYFVFGAPRERIGDSARIDMTKGEPGPAGFNAPPFHTIYLQKEDIHNGNKVFLITQGETNSGEITPADKVLSANFLTPYGGTESMLVIKPGGKPELYHYCPDRQVFEQVPLDCPADIYPLLQGYAWEKGRFLPSTNDQLLVTGPEGMALLGIEKTGAPCASRNGIQARVKLLWRSSGLTLEEVTLREDKPPACGDLNGDRLTELILFDKEGSWKLLRFTPGGPDGGRWTPLATGEEYPVREWNPDLNLFRISAGKYLSRFDQNILLTTFQDKKSGKLGYSLLRYDIPNKKFLPPHQGRQGNEGVTIGLDTLKPGDPLFQVTFAKGRLAFLRYNRDWRFDLKEIRFNDTTFQALENVDFTGFTGDQNPKYYEILKLFTGNWIDPAVTSVLVIARNCKDNNYKGGDCQTYEELPALPNTLQIYSLQTQK
ncbi:MAG: hypothetical protein V1733_03810 [bacterium]